MRVVLICPYSLSLPGGVQGQVLGLARTLRQRGISATVIGPCDGPPPEAGVVSVGPSVSLAAIDDSAGTISIFDSSYPYNEIWRGMQTD